MLLLLTWLCCLLRCSHLPLPPPPAAPAEAALGEHGVPEGPACHPAPIPALPPQLRPDTEGKGGGTQFCMRLSTPSSGLRLTSLSSLLVVAPLLPWSSRQTLCCAAASTPAGPSTSSTLRTTSRALRSVSAAGLRGERSRLQGGGGNVHIPTFLTSCLAVNQAGEG